MLEAAAIPFRTSPAHIDERAVEAGLGAARPNEVALALARAKALAVSAGAPGELVLGSDSLVTCEGFRFDKPGTREAATEHLRFFSGKVMELHSAAALARDGEVVWSDNALAQLHVVPMSDEFIRAYLDAEWPAVAGCVGVFRFEGRGVQLFEKVEGDYFTILGLSLLPLLEKLRELGVIDG